MINIITKKGTRNETTIDLSFGSWHKCNYELTNQGSLGKFSWFASGGLEQSHGFKCKGSYDNLSGTGNYSDNHFTVRMDNQFDERNSLTFGAWHPSHHYGLGKNSAGLYNNTSLSYNFKETTALPGWFRYYNNYRTTATPGGGNTDARIQGLEYQNGWELGRHKVIAGFEYHQNKLNQKYYSIDDKKFQNTAIYMQDAMKLGNKWIMIPGVRYDHSSKWGDKTKIYASWGSPLQDRALTLYYWRAVRR